MVCVEWPLPERLPLQSHSSASELKVILLGEEWVGKSSAGNIILGYNAFPLESTEQVTRRSRELFGKSITVVDTPGWDPQSSPDIPHRILERACGSAAHGGLEGPHVILLTLPVCLNAEWNKKIARRLHGLFGKTMWQHTILLFTRAHLLGGKSIKEHLEGKGQALQVLVEKCEHRYHALDNIKTVNADQMKGLLEKMEQMVEENSGRCFIFDQAHLDQHSTQIVKMASQISGQEETGEAHEEEEIESMRLLEWAKIHWPVLNEKKQRKRNRRKKKKHDCAIIRAEEEQMKMEANKNSAVRIEIVDRWHEQPENIQLEEEVESELDEQSESTHEEMEMKVLPPGLPPAFDDDDGDDDDDDDEEGRKQDEPALTNTDREIETLPPDDTKLEIKNVVGGSEPCLNGEGKDYMVRYQNLSQTQAKYERFAKESTTDDWRNASEKPECTTELEDKLDLNHKEDYLKEIESELIASQECVEVFLKVMATRDCKSYIDQSQVINWFMDHGPTPVDDSLLDVDFSIVIDQHKGNTAPMCPETNAQEGSFGENVENKRNGDTKGICKGVHMQPAIKEGEDMSRGRKHERGNGRKCHSDSIDDSPKNQRDEEYKASVMAQTLRRNRRSRSLDRHDKFKREGNQGGKQRKEGLKNVKSNGADSLG